MAAPHFLEEIADDSPVPVPPEPLPDPASHENLRNPEEVSVYASKQSKSANSPADIYHVLFNQMKPFASPALKSWEDLFSSEPAHLWCLYL